METLAAHTKVQTLDEARGQWKTWDVFPGRYSDASPDPEHMEVLVAALSAKGVGYWNDWRAAHPSIQPNLARIEFAVGTRRRAGPVWRQLVRLRSFRRDHESVQSRLRQT